MGVYDGIRTLALVGTSRCSRAARMALRIHSFRIEAQMTQAPTFSNIKLRGTYYRGAFATQLARTLVAGDGLINMREPSNPHDSNAIKIFYDETHIGYVGRESAGEIARWMDQGWTFLSSVQETHCYGLVTRTKIWMRFVPLGKPQQATKKEADLCAGL